LASLTGASVDERTLNHMPCLPFTLLISCLVKLLFIFLLSYPLSGLLKRIPDSKPWQKNIYSITISMVYLVGILDLWSGFWNLVFGAIAAYTIAATIVDPIMPWVGFAVLMGHMSVSHLYRQSVNQIGVIDITGAQMVLVMKLTAFCWNVHDGRMKDEDLTDFQRERAIRQLPGLLDYAGFVLFFPSLMAGPAFDYVDYAKYITTSMFDLPPGTDPAKAPPTRKKRRIPRSGTPAMLKMATGLIWVLAFLLLAGKINNDFMLSDEFLSYGIFTRIFWLYLFGFTTRTKYYGVWNLTEGSCILAGIGYAGIDPQTGRANWDRLVNIKPFGVEFAQNTRAYLGSWNINTNNWLRNYIYLRVTPKGKKPGFRSTLATFLTSAFWHGFYPGYYLTFVMGALLQNIAQSKSLLSNSAIKCM
jgi:lysophospholipid acyltransferase